MVTSDKLKIFFLFFVFFFCFNFFPKIHLCTNNWHRRETFGYAVGWVSRGEKEKNKMLSRFLGVGDAPGSGSSIHWCDTANLSRAGVGAKGSPRSKLSMRSSHRLAAHACSHGGLTLSLGTWVMGWWVSPTVEVQNHSVTVPRVTKSPNPTGDGTEGDRTTHPPSGPTASACPSGSKLIPLWHCLAGST